VEGSKDLQHQSQPGLDRRAAGKIKDSRDPRCGAARPEEFDMKKERKRDRLPDSPPEAPFPEEVGTQEFPPAEQEPERSFLDGQLTAEPPESVVAEIPAPAQVEIPTQETIEAEAAVAEAEAVEEKQPAKIEPAVCLRDCADDRMMYERGKVYQVDLKTHPCREYFKPRSQVEDLNNPGQPPSPYSGLNHAERQARRQAEERP